jgi:ribose transport system ATP-binding protein
MMTADPIDGRTTLVARGVTKSFNSNRALDNFDLTLSAGEVHALVGHNGSGKSTFIKVLAGFYVPESGEVEVVGEPLKFGDPTSSSTVGLSFVHQTLGLVPSLSVLENLHLGKSYDINFLGKVNWRREHETAAARLRDFGLGVDPRTRVGDLNTIERVEVAIVRALSESAGITTLVLDEATAALTDQEVNRLFATVRRVQAAGVSVLYVSHRLDELPQIADSITVMRDGKIVERGSMSEFTNSRLVRLIAGDAAPLAPRQTLSAQAIDKDAAPVLELRGVNGTVLRDVDLTGRQGEILGVVGLLGSGVEELVDVLVGRATATSGSLRISGRPARLGDVAAMARRHFNAVVGDKSERIIAELDLAENATLQVVKKFFVRGNLRTKKLRRRAAEILAEFKVQPAILDMVAGSLSGGNQQKLAIGRVLQAEPTTLLLEEPFHGVDVRGRQEIIAVLDAARRNGQLIVIVDSDLDEIVNICDTIVVLRNGQVAMIAEGDDKNKQRLLEACYGEMVDAK